MPLLGQSGQVPGRSGNPSLLTPGPVAALQHYHALPAWQPGVAQVLVAAFHPMLLTKFTAPLAWVVAFTVVAL